MRSISRQGPISFLRCSSLVTQLGQYEYPWIQSFDAYGTFFFLLIIRTPDDASPRPRFRAGRRLPGLALRAPHDPTTVMFGMSRNPHRKGASGAVAQCVAVLRKETALIDPAAQPGIRRG